MSPRGGRASDGGRRSSPEFRGDAARLFGVVLLAYGVGSVLTWESLGGDVGPTSFYPAAGVTAAAMLLNRRSLWPAIVAAVFVVEIVVDTRYGSNTWEALGFAAANVIEPLIGSSLALAWCRGIPDLRRRRDFARFIAANCLTGPFAGALIGGSVIAAHDHEPWVMAVLNWWTGDALGVLVVASPILLWVYQSSVIAERKMETVGVLAATAGLSFAAFWTGAPPSLLVLPVLAWAALRLDMIGAALAGAVTAVLANIMTAWGHGVFGSMGVGSGTEVVLTQLFVATIVIVAMLIALEASGRLRAITEREAERQDRLRVETLARLSQQLAAALTPKDIGEALEEQVLNEAGAKALNLGLVSRDGSRLEWVVMSGYPAPVVAEYAGGVAMSERTVATDAVRTGQPVLVRTSAEYVRRYPEKAQWVRLSGARSVVGWPLSSGGSPIGVVLLMWAEHQPLDQVQLAYVSAVATMVSQALVRARIYEDEHARAAVLQTAVLPTSPGETPGLDVCVTYEPADVAQGLGGDWYDIMLLPKGRTYIAVGDVVGHGLPAVEDMAQLRSAGRVLAHQGLPTDRLLSELNGFTRHASQGKFATMTAAIFDPAHGSLFYCSAGHPPPLLRQARTGQVIRLSDAGGPVLGPLESARYTEGHVRVEPDDILVMYTDGLVERRGTDIETGISRMERMVAGWNDGTALHDVCEVLHQDLAPRPRADDICIIAVRFANDRDVVGAASAR